MPSALVSQTAQGAALSVVANVLAQVISSYKNNTNFSLDLAPILKFIGFSIVSNPPNIIWQTFLEDLYPTTVYDAPPKPSTTSGKPKPTAELTSRTSIRNVLIKFALDQTIGAVVNTLMFLVFMGYVNASPAGKQGPWGEVSREIEDKFWPMIMDGYKFWPAFSLISFVWIPVDKRVVAGCLVGVGWGVYLSLMVS